MDWWKLFALLVAVASLHVTAEGPKKKIRIHLPQKVKHIHHHKKIYITNHPAQSQYAPAFLPNAEGAVAVPTNVALPAVASLVPLNSVELYEGSQNRLPGTASAASKLLPLYRARGYYGPNHSEWNEQEYDLAPPPEPTDSYMPPAYSPPVAASASTKYPLKRVKVLKVSDAPRKKVPRKTKPKHAPVRGRPEEEHPVSPFHEQFYSELDGSATIKKIKKPPRVEKIIDGDTEHIHTYSEEHIHKLVFDEGPKFGVPGVPAGHVVRPVDHIPSMSAHHIPFRNPHSLLTYPPGPYGGLTAVGSMGTPAHLEYAAYNAHDVTHDHIFHDHGEITSDLDLTKEDLSYPPKASYNSQGLRITGGGSKRQKEKPSYKYAKPSPSSDFSYYESIYTPHSKQKKTPKPTIPTPHYESSPEINFDDFRPVSTFKVKNKSKLKSRYIAPSSHFKSEQSNDYRLQEASVPAPFSLSSTVVHDYKPKTYSGTAQAQSGFTNFNDPFVDFKGSYSNNFEYDTYASSSNVHPSESKDQNNSNKKKKKSISTQNISFGDLTYPDKEHQRDVSEHELPISQEVNEGFNNLKSTDSTMPTDYTIKESSPVHKYYTAMAVKALQNDPLSVPEASNDNFQYVEAPTTSKPPVTTSIATTTSVPPRYIRLLGNDAVAIKPPETVPSTRQDKRRREKNLAASKAELNYPVLKDFQSPSQVSGRVPHSLRHLGHKYANDHETDTSIVRGKVKYGDRI